MKTSIIKIFLAVIIGFTFFSTSSVAAVTIPSEWSDCKDIIQAIEADNYEEALATANFLSAAGNTNAKYLLAAMSMCGAGGAKNYDVALDVLKELASAGDRRAQYMLGGFGSLDKQHEMMKIILGEDIPTDDNSFWYMMMSTGMKADDFKDTLPWFFAPLDSVAYRDIMYYAGLFCLNSQFGYTDIENGLEWLQESAMQGYPEAVQLLQQIVNSMNEDGDSIEPGGSVDEEWYY